MSVVKVIARTLAFTLQHPLMPRPARPQKRSTLSGQLGAFVAERYPFAVDAALEAFASVAGRRALDSERDIEGIRARFRRELGQRLAAASQHADLPETTPGTNASTRLKQAREEIVEASDAFLRRAALQASLTPDERREIL